MKIKYIIGIDEAGRGPLAGPLAVGGVVIPINTKIEHEYFSNGIRDSKKLTEIRRNKLFDWIKENKDMQYSVAFAPASLIDTAGVTIAINKAVSGVLEKLLPRECGESDILVLLDGGLRAPEAYINQKTIIKGDENEAVIALASVAAKVTRDKRMVGLSKKYPEYGFEKHKGYGTKLHYEKIKQFGPCKEHRRRFLKNLKTY